MRCGTTDSKVTPLPTRMIFRTPSPLANVSGLPSLVQTTVVWVNIRGSIGHSLFRATAPVLTPPYGFSDHLNDFVCWWSAVYHRRRESSAARFCLRRQGVAKKSIIGRSAEKHRETSRPRNRRPAFCATTVPTGTQGLPCDPQNTTRVSRAAEHLST